MPPNVRIGHKITPGENAARSSAGESSAATIMVDTGWHPPGQPNLVLRCIDRREAEWVAAHWKNGQVIEMPSDAQ